MIVIGTEKRAEFLRALSAGDTIPISTQGHLGDQYYSHNPVHREFIGRAHRQVDREPDPHIIGENARGRGSPHPACQGIRGTHQDRAAEGPQDRQVTEVRRPGQARAQAVMFAHLGGARRENRQRHNIPLDEN